MPLYDAVKDLTLHDRESRARAARPAAQAHHPPDHRRPSARGRRGGRRRGRLLRGGAAAPVHARRAARSHGRAHTRLVLGAGGRASPGYRIWGLESAALDLALRQAGALARGRGRARARARHVRRLAERRAGAARALPRDPLQARRERQVDGRGRRRSSPRPAPSTSSTSRASTTATGSSDTVGRAVRPRRRRIPAGLARGRAHQRRDAPALEPHRDRLTWDFPIHSVDDVEALEWPPRCLNSKPSRFGSVRRLFDFYDHCAANGIEVYGGGQFELGPGRGQIQHLASLFHPDAPNDVAPKEYNDGGPRPGLPQSPLPPASPRARLPLAGQGLGDVEGRGRRAGDRSPGRRRGDGRRRARP